MLAQHFRFRVSCEQGAERRRHVHALAARITDEYGLAEGVQRVVLVTSASHMPRSRWCFEEVGLEVIAAPVGFVGVPNGRPFGGWLPETKAIWQNGLLLNEAVGMLLYPLLYGGES